MFCNFWFRVEYVVSGSRSRATYPSGVKFYVNMARRWVLFLVAIGVRGFNSPSVLVYVFSLIL